MKRFVRLVCVGVMVSLVYVAGLGAQEVQKIDACSILSKAEIEAEVKQPVGDGQLKGAGVIAPCQYKVGDYGVLSVQLATAGPQTADKVLEDFGKRKIAVSDVADLGDRSFFSSPGYGMIQLNTFKGSDYLIITMLLSGSTEGAQKTSAVNLMQIALEKR